MTATMCAPNFGCLSRPSASKTVVDSTRFIPARPWHCAMSLLTLRVSCHAIATGWVVNSLGEKNRHKAGAVSPRTKDCRGRPAPARGTRPYRWRGGRVSSGWTLPRRAADQGRRVRRFSRRVRSPLTLNDEDCRQRPLEERREALSRLVAGIDGVVFSEAIEADGAIVFAKACEMGLEGIVSKRVGSRYWSGPNRQWLKVKNPEFPRATSVRAR